jgi:hypothetical protein
MMEEMIVWWRWLMRDLVKRSFLPLLLLVKDVEGVLHRYEPCSLPVDVLPASFGTLGCSLPS